MLPIDSFVYLIEFRMAFSSFRYDLAALYIITKVSDSKFQSDITSYDIAGEFLWTTVAMLYALFAGVGSVNN